MPKIQHHLKKHASNIRTVLALVACVALGYVGASVQYSDRLNRAQAAFPRQQAMMTVSGTIERIAGNTITLQSSPSANPFMDVPTVRDITVTNSTTIVKSEPKEPAVLKREIDAYQTALQKAYPTGPNSSCTAETTFLIPPTPIAETAISLAGLKTGDFIIVDADKDVTILKNFEARKIALGNLSPAFAQLGPASGGTAPIVDGPPPARQCGGVAPVFYSAASPRR